MKIRAKILRQRKSPALKTRAHPIVIALVIPQKKSLHPRRMVSRPLQPKQGLAQRKKAQRYDSFIYIIDP